MAEDVKKGVSEEAKAYSKQIRDRFVEFVKERGIKEVSSRTNCSIHALRNSVVQGYNPSLDTICQVKLGYKDEFSEVYLFQGKLSEDHVIEAGDDVDSLKEQLRYAQEKLAEKEETIKELKSDKAFLQDLIKNGSPVITHG
ncbi:hypothetical protein GCM10027578_26940 [Spirosoma luteolum]